MLQKETTSYQVTCRANDADLNRYNLRSEIGSLQMKIFMDYCYFIEKAWLDWKHFCLRLFLPNERTNRMQN